MGNHKETTGLKALAIRYLQGNQSGNHQEYRVCKRNEACKLEINNDAGFEGAVEIITSGGERLWVVTIKEAMELVPPDAVYFTRHEIEILSKGTRRAAKDALKVKKVFGHEVRVRALNRLSDEGTKAKVIDLFPIGGIMVMARLENDSITIVGMGELDEAGREAVGSNSSINQIRLMNFLSFAYFRPLFAWSGYFQR